ncbi:MAG: VWA domain-containing protein [Pseudomonadota bacterium]
MPHIKNPSENYDASLANWEDACLAIELAAGMASSPSFRMPTFHIRAQAGPVLDIWLERLESVLPEKPIRRIQTATAFVDLLGNLDLSATLVAGERVYETGLLSRCHDGLLAISLSGPMMPDMAAGLGSVLDSGSIPINDCSTDSPRALNLGLVVIDQAEQDTEFLPVSLRDRLMFHLDLTEVKLRDAASTHNPSASCAIRPALCDASLAEELCTVSLSFGLTSLRPSLQAIHVAAFHAGFHGRGMVEREDVFAAIRLSLKNQATIVPFDETSEEFEEESPSQEDEENTTDAVSKSSDNVSRDMDVSSISATLPAELLADLKRSQNMKPGKRLTGRSGEKTVSFKRGRPIESMRGNLDYGKRLDLIATLRASAPWQKMRKEHSPNPNRIQVRRRDFHVKRYIKPSESTTIFVVDASGSTAVNRLGEAKGAVELLLGESYSRRDQVALISLRGVKSELVLPPTRSLARARNALSGLRGGGGTPLAHGLQKAMFLAQDEMRKGRTPNLVLLTDGSANIPLDSEPGRDKAMRDALAMAGELASLGIGILVIDVSRSIRGHAKKIADEMHAKYVPMPFASSKNICNAVRVGQI